MLHFKSRVDRQREWAGNGTGKGKGKGTGMGWIALDITISMSIGERLLALLSRCRCQFILDIFGH